MRVVGTSQRQNGVASGDRTHALGAACVGAFLWLEVVRLRRRAPRKRPEELPMMIMSALFWVCLCLLLAVFAALLLDFRDFRAFVIHPSPEGAASVGGWFSFRGSVLLLMTLAIVVGVCSPLLTSRVSDDGSANEIQAKNSGLKDQVSELSNTVADLRTPDGVLGTIATWDRDDNVTAKLAAMAGRREGPWSLPESEKLLASVPGEIGSGLAEGCAVHYEKTLQLVGDGLRPTVNVDVDTLMYRAANCRDITGFDLKLSCPDASQIFGDSRLTCAGLIPLWADGESSLLIVQSVEVEMK